MNAPLAILSPIYTLLIAAALNVFLCRQQVVAKALSTPMSYASRAIDMLERRYNREEFTDRMRKVDGLSTMIVVILVAFLASLGVDLALNILPFGWILEAMIVATLLMHRVHYDQSLLLSRGLRRSPEEGRATLAWIAGYDALRFNDQEMAAVGTQFSARSLNEGVVAPVLWYLVLGLPGIFIFKAINVAHHMIDEKTEYSACFGWAPARLHEILLFPASIISAPIAAVASLLLPDAGWLNAVKALSTRLFMTLRQENGPVTLVMAAALGVNLPLDPMAPNGSDNVNLFPNLRNPNIEDIERARHLFVLSVMIFFAIIVVGYAFGWIQPLFHISIGNGIAF